MPLKQGKSKDVIEENIRELIRSGRDPSQAAAIAYKEAGQGKKPKTTKTKAKRAKSSR